VCSFMYVSSINHVNGLLKQQRSCIKTPEGGRGQFWHRHPRKLLPRIGRAEEPIPQDIQGETDTPCDTKYTPMDHGSPREVTCLPGHWKEDMGRIPLNDEAAGAKP
jgi:hypothetical protein